MSRCSKELRLKWARITAGNRTNRWGLAWHRVVTAEILCNRLEYSIEYSSEQSSYYLKSTWRWFVLFQKDHSTRRSARAILDRKSVFPDSDSIFSHWVINLIVGIYVLAVVVVQDVINFRTCVRRTRFVVAFPRIENVDAKNIRYSCFVALFLLPEYKNINSLIIK